MREIACLVSETGDSHINQAHHEEGTFYAQDFTAWSRDLRVTDDGDDVVSLAGAVDVAVAIAAGARDTVDIEARGPSGRSLIERRTE